MEEDDFFQIQLEIALEESKSSGNIAATAPSIEIFSDTRPLELTSQELAFFTDENLFISDTPMKRNDNSQIFPRSYQKFSENNNSFHVRTGYSNMGKPSPINNETSSVQVLPTIRGFSSSFTSSRPKELAPSVAEFCCHKCMQKFSGPHVEAIDRCYHKECFKCGRCQKLIVQLNSFIPYGTPLEPHHPQCVQDIIDNSSSQLPEACFQCKKSILSGAALKSALGRSYHPKCFTCYRCKKIIEDQSFAPYGDREQQPYHLLCLQEELSSMDRKKKSGTPSSSSCFKCKKSFHLFSEQVLSIPLLPDRKYHVTCFRCEGCQQQIGQGGFCVVDRDSPQPYHHRCATELFNPRCCICCKAMTGQYKSHIYFKDEIYCVDVSHEQRKCCCSCGRREPFLSAKEVQTVMSYGDNFFWMPYYYYNSFLSRNLVSKKTNSATCRTAECSVGCV